MNDFQDLITEIKCLKHEMSRLKCQVVPVGAVEAFAMQNAPEGWLVCDGGMYREELFPLLSKTIGSTYNTPDTPKGFFCVPDLQGIFVRGWDGYGNVDPERDFGSTQKDALQGHRHDCRQGEYTDFAGDHFHSFKYHAEIMKSGTFGDSYRVVCHESDDRGWIAVNTIGNHNHKIPDITIGEVSSSSYGSIKERVAIETRPKNIALLYCIKAK